MSDFETFGNQLRQLLSGFLRPSEPGFSVGMQQFKIYSPADVTMKSVSPITIVFKETQPDSRRPLADPVNQPNEEVVFVGHIIVRRGNPRQRPDGRWEVPQEIIEADAVGQSRVLGGAVRIIQNPNKRTLGTTVQRDPGIDFPADSSFNVHFQLLAADNLNIPPLINALEVNVASAEITRIPPLFHAYRHRYDERPVPLVDETGNIHAWFVEGRKVLTDVDNQRPLLFDPFA
jgi:hypothetical protein